MNNPVTKAWNKVKVALWPATSRTDRFVRWFWTKVADRTK